MKEKYIVKYFLSARHYVVINGVKSIVHTHTWQIKSCIVTHNRIDYKLLDGKIEKILGEFDDILLNENENFKSIEPSTENLGRVLFEKISTEAENIEYILESLGICENASKTFIIERT